MKFPDELFFRPRPKLPVVMASELAECGLACLAMVATFHGHETDLTSLRRRFSISLAGANLRGLMRLADHLQLSSRALRVEMSALDRVQVPAIIHWDMNHYVVLKSVSRKAAVIHDPARGRVALSLKELSNHFTGVVLELAPAASFQKASERTRFRIRDLFSKITGHRAAISYVVMLSVALQVLSLLLPFQMQFVIDKAVGSNDVSILLIIVLSFGALTILNAVVTALRNWTLQLLSSQIIFQVAGNVFRHIIRLSANFFEKRHLGDILSRLGSIRQIQDALTQGLLSAFIDGSMALLAGVALFMYSPVLATIIAATVLVYAVITILSYPIIRKQTERAITASAKEQSYLMESIRGIIAIKLMGGEPGRESAWRNLYGRSFNEGMAVTRTQQKLKLAEDLIFGFQYAAILYLAAASIINGSGFTVGMLFSFLAFRGIFTERAMTLIARGLQLGMLNLHIERLGDFVAEEPEIPPGGGMEANLEGSIVFRDVAFRYGATDALVLEDVNIEIHQGEFIAITGPTGGGKTTLLKLLLGLQRPTLGRILLNGELAVPALWQAWRSQIGVVRQDDQLFSGTLAENISFFDPNPSMERVVHAAVAARIDQEIARMPLRYLTLVGDMGSTLSGGQRQRILLARALYRSPKMLVLDEGTANLDPKTEEAIADALAEMSVTRIVVAHRPALVERASRVFNVENGKVQLVRERPTSTLYVSSTGRS